MSQSFPASPSAAPPTGSARLVLFPTELELRRFTDFGALPGGLAVQALCGFGPIAAAARTAQLIAAFKPAQVFLCGIAGAYDTDRHPTGHALEFGHVGLDGVGAGEGAEFQGPPAMGFAQWPGSEDTTDYAVEEELPLAPIQDNDLGLLTTCAASASGEQTRRRRERFPRAVAEDMEGFGVALACALGRTPLSIVRGISNQVGDRDPSHWRIPAALSAARKLLIERLESQ